MTDVTEPKTEEAQPAETTAAPADDKKITSSAVFSMFGGGAKKEKKDDEDDRGDVSGSAKAQRDAAAAAAAEASASKDDEDEIEGGEPDDGYQADAAHIKTEKDRVREMTELDTDEVFFNHTVKLYLKDDNQWKNRAVGPARICKGKENGVWRLIVRQEKQVMCNHRLTKGTSWTDADGSGVKFIFNALNDASADKDGPAIIKDRWFLIRFKDSTDSKGAVTKSVEDTVKDFRKYYVQGQEENAKLSE